jgi:outer membrane lipoprotein LolB
VLSKLKTWNIDAMIGIRNVAKHDSGSASMQWQQSRANYSILLFGPLGAGSTKLTGQPGSVTLAMADGKTFHAKTPELLVTQQTGWRLPVSNLYYWVRGLPVPSLPADKKLDSSNHLVELSQGGWRVQYLDYKTINQIDMPTKILLANPDLNVKIIIRSWHF